MSEGRASKLRPGSALVGPRFSLMDLSTTPKETDMQTPQLQPGAILASPQGRGTITIVSVEPALLALLDERLYTWRLDSARQTLTRMEFAVVGHEEPAVLAARVELAERVYQLRTFGRAA